MGLVHERRKMMIATVDDFCKVHEVVVMKNKPDSARAQELLNRVSIEVTIGAFLCLVFSPARVS